MNALKEQREKVMLSQGELAEKSGVGISAINKIENDKETPWPKTVRKLAEALECPLSDLASLRVERSDTNGESE